MKTHKPILILIISLLMSCTTNPDKNKNDEKVYYTLENIDVSEKWIEIPDRNQPVKRDFGDLRTVHLTHINNKEVLVFNYGNESHVFEIKMIEKSKDSLIFSTLLPNDTTDIITISMKYLDKDKFMARWIVNGVNCNYFRYKDTVGNNRVTIE